MTLARTHWRHTGVQSILSKMKYLISVTETDWCLGQETDITWHLYCIAWSRLSTSVTSHDTFYCLITIKYWCDITWYAERVSLRQCHTNKSGKLCNCGSTSMTLSLRDKVLETKIDQKYNIYHSRNHSTLVILKQNNHMYVMYNWIENFWFLR